MNIELSENEILLLLFGLGSWATMPAVSTPEDRNHPAQAHALAMRLLDVQHAYRANLPLPVESHEPQRRAVPSPVPGNHEQLPGAVPTGRAQSSHEPERTSQGTVRWSTGKFDRGAVEQIRVTPSKIERKESANGPFLKVMWLAHGARGTSNASCFDKDLFGFLANCVTQETVLYVVHKDHYMNIVGVEA